MKTLDEFVFALERAEAIGSLAVEPTGTRMRCSICDEEVALLKDRIPVLYAPGSVWRNRRPEAHRRECFEAAQRRVQAIDTSNLDLWAR